MHISQKQYRIGADHPSLAGHFPGNPVVPGVVILSTIFVALQQDYPGWQIAGIRKLKFLRPLPPEQDFTLEHTQIKNSGLRFKCHLSGAGTLFVEGHLNLLKIGDS